MLRHLEVSLAARGAWSRTARFIAPHFAAAVTVARYARVSAMREPVRGLKTRSQVTQERLNNTSSEHVRRAFLAHSRNELRQIADGVRPMRDVNTGMLVQLADDASNLVVEGNGHRFTITADDDAQHVVVVTPRHARVVYTYDQGADTWKDTSDGHLLRELLMRDLMYYLKGYPTF